MPTLPRGSISGPPAADDEHTSSALQAGPQADAAAAAAAAATPAVAAAPYVTSRMEAEAAAQGRPIPTLCCPDCGKTRKVELISQQTGAPKIRYISGPTYVSTNRNKVQKCSCKECGVFFLEPPPDGGQQEDECGGRQLTDDGAGVGAGVGVALTAAAPAAAAVAAAATAEAAATWPSLAPSKASSCFLRRAPPPPPFPPPPPPPPPPAAAAFAAASGKIGGHTAQGAKDASAAA